MTLGRLTITRRNWRRWVAWSAVACVTLVSADLLFGTPGSRELRSLGDAPKATTVYDMSGAPVFTIFKERRIPVALSDISPHAIHAVLAAEDQRFYGHHGLDLWRIGGAAVANVKSGTPGQGGSTI